jgi:hypothetical protein
MRIADCGLRIRHRVCSLLAIAALGLVAAPARAETFVLLADGRGLDGVTLKPGAGPDQVSIERPGAPASTTPVRNLLVVDYGKLPGRGVTPTVRMANGDQVYGKLSYPSAKQVKVSAGWGSITIPLRWCSAVRIGEKAPLPEPVTKDTLLLSSDRVQGEIQGLSDTKVTIGLAGKPVQLDMSRVQALALAPTAKPAEKPEGTGVLLGIDLGGGERLTGWWISLGPDVLTIRLPWGDNLDVPVGSIARIEVKNGRLVYLSELRPAEVRQIPYIDGSFPFKNDRSVSGRPLRLAGKSYRRGLGTHSRCELTYALNGGYQSFAATLGIDQAVGPQGSVVFRVYGDERLLYESPVVHGGDAPIPLNLDVKRVLLLRLEVDFADNGDAADHADWADARLLRP